MGTQAIQQARTLTDMTVGLNGFQWHDGLNTVARARGFSVSLLIRGGRVVDWVIVDASGRKRPTRSRARPVGPALPAAPALQVPPARLYP
jgi:hypothetical protein